VPKKTQQSQAVGKPVKKEFSCPFRGESGYVRARLIRDPDLPGWLVLYDRGLGDVVGMSHIDWDERTRYVLMWRPLPGEAGKVKYKAGPNEQWAKEPLAWAAKGRDALGLWGGKPATLQRPNSAVSQACAHHARPLEAAPPAVPATPPPGVPEGAKPVKLPRPKASGTRESEYDGHLLEQLPLEEAARRLAHISENAMKTTWTNGVPVESEDWKVRLDALKEYNRLIAIGAAQREKEKVQRELDESDLALLVMTDVGREQLKLSARHVLDVVEYVERVGELPDSMRGLHAA
jgi:hypothetical protein